MDRDCKSSGGDDRTVVLGWGSGTCGRKGKAGLGGAGPICCGDNRKVMTQSEGGDSVRE